jgi:ribosomal protein L7/L12
VEQIKVDQNAQNIAQLAAAIAQLQRTTDFILKQLKLEYTDNPAGNLAPELAEKISALIRQGQKGELEAIKVYRSQAGGGMIEAMAVVQDMKKAIPPR